MQDLGKIAIVHEMLVKIGGAEKVVESITKKYPQADIFTLMYDEEKIGNMFPKNKIHPNVFSLPSQKLYKLTKRQRLSLPLMSRSIEQIDLSTYDTVIVSSSGYAHGIITKPDTKTVIYYHSPARYMWDWTNEYKKDIGMNKGIKGYLLNKFLLKSRIWDVIASKRHDITLANSKNTALRIKKYYRRDAQILYPPIETERFQKELDTNFTPPYNDYYIIISALTEFKKIDIAIEAFNYMEDKNLIIIGRGDQEENLKGLIKGKNIQLVGAKYDDELVHYVQNSNGLVFPGEEDFGMVPVETLAAGKPVFALKKGGLLETVIEGGNGDFFENENGSDFITNFQLFDTNNKEGKYNPDFCKKSAEKFSEEAFHNQLTNILHKK